MSTSDKKRRRGSVLINVSIVLVLMVAASTFLTQMTGMLQKSGYKNIRATRELVMTNSAVDVILTSYRFAEQEYIREIQACGSSVPFLHALKNGHNCAGVTVDVWDIADPSPDPGATPDAQTGLALYEFVGPGCRIRNGRSTCESGTPHVLSLPNMIHNRDLASEAGRRYDVYIHSIRPDDQIIEFSIWQTKGTVKTKQAFAIRTALSNTAHIEADGRVTQENPDPLAVCKGDPWTNYPILDENNNCITFAQLGSGTGLAYYNYRYFGFRPNDGQVIDLLAASEGKSSYRVNSLGLVAGVQVFPPYKKAKLINVDDLTLIKDQIYYVAGSGVDAHIGVLKMPAATREVVCKLGIKGWGQAYSGIAALGHSDPLLPAGDQLTSRHATFFLKTDAGDLLTAVVVGGATGGPYNCSVFRDANLQQVEYKRTYGFERTINAKPYFLY